MKFDVRRLKNYGLWVAIASLLFMVVQDLGFHVTPEKWNTYVDVILGILVMLGIISNPKEGKWFGDQGGEE
jgi:uncharacterized membrane protein